MLDSEFATMAGIASTEELAAAALRTRDHSITDIGSRRSARSFERTNTSDALEFLRRSRSSAAPSDIESSFDDDEVAPIWMVEEAVRRSSKRITGQALTEVRRKLSTMRIADVIDLMAPLDEAPLVTAGDFAPRSSEATKNSARARRRRSSRASSQVLFAPQGVAAATREPTAQPLARRASKRHGKRAAVLLSLIATAPPPLPDDEEDVVTARCAVEGVPAPAPPPPPLPVQRALLELTEAEVQRLLVCWSLECFAAQFAIEHTDGAALNDIEGIEDLDDFSNANRRQCKKLIRLIGAARADGVGLPGEA